MKSRASATPDCITAWGLLSAVLCGIELSLLGAEAMNSTTPPPEADFVIVGTESSGLSAAFHAGRAGTGSYLEAARWTADGDEILAGAPWQAWRPPSWEESNAAEAKDPPAPG